MNLRLARKTCENFLINFKDVVLVVENENFLAGGHGEVGLRARDQAPARCGKFAKHEMRQCREGSEQFFARPPKWHPGCYLGPAKLPARMLQFFKNLFRKPAALPTARIPRMTTSQQPVMALPQVEIASLSLRAIIERFPADLKESVVNIPPSEVMVALPVPTIIKQLPSGSVKMSLASVYRQAPGGTFSATRVEDKRMVEVP